VQAWFYTQATIGTNVCVLMHMYVRVYMYHRRFIIQRGHAHTRTGNLSESGFWSRMGAPSNISRCVGGGIDAATLVAALGAGLPPPDCRWGRRHTRTNLGTEPVAGAGGCTGLATHPGRDRHECMCIYAYMGVCMYVSYTHTHTQKQRNNFRTLTHAQTIHYTSN